MNNDYVEPGPLARQEMRARAMQTLQREAYAAGKAEVDQLRARLAQKYADLERARSERVAAARVLGKCACSECARLRVEARLARQPDAEVLFCEVCRSKGVHHVSKTAQKIARRDAQLKEKRVAELDRMLQAIDNFKQEAGFLEGLATAPADPSGHNSELLRRYRQGYDLDAVLGPEGEVRGADAIEDAPHTPGPVPPARSQPGGPTPPRVQGGESVSYTSSSAAHRRPSGRGPGPTTKPSSSAAAAAAQSTLSDSSPLDSDHDGSDRSPSPRNAAEPTRSRLAPDRVATASAAFKEAEEGYWGRSREAWLELIERMSLDALVEQADRAAALAPSPELRLRALQTAGQLRGLAVELRTSRQRQDKVRKLYAWTVRQKQQQTDRLGRIDIRQRAARDPAAHDAIFGPFSAAAPSPAAAATDEENEPDEFDQILRRRLLDARAAAASLLAESFRDRSLIPHAPSPSPFTPGDPVRSAKKSEERYVSRMEKARAARVPVAQQPYFSLPDFPRTGEEPYTGGRAHLDWMLISKPVGPPAPLPSYEEDWRGQLDEDDLDRYLFDMLWQQGAIGEEHLAALTAALAEMEEEEEEEEAAYDGHLDPESEGLPYLRRRERAPSPDLTTISEETTTITSSRPAPSASLSTPLSTAPSTSTLTAPTASSAARAADAAQRRGRPDSGHPLPKTALPAWGSKAAAAGPRSVSARRPVAAPSEPPSSDGKASGSDTEDRDASVTPSSASRALQEDPERGSAATSSSLSLQDRATAVTRGAARYEDSDSTMNASLASSSDFFVHDGEEAPRPQPKPKVQCSTAPPPATSARSSRAPTGSGTPSERSVAVSIRVKTRGRGAAHCASSDTKPLTSSRGLPGSGPGPTVGNSNSNERSQKEAEAQTEPSPSPAGKGVSKSDFVPPPGWFAELKRSAPLDVAAQVARALKLGSKLLESL